MGRPSYNLMERTVEPKVLPAAQHHRLGLLPWSPLAGGLLAGSNRNLGTGRRADDSTLRYLAGSCDQQVPA
jgi:NDP-hexose 2,3-enoyl reductase